MITFNNKISDSREPAKDYRKRARVVIERLLLCMKAFVEPKRWKEPTPELIEGLIDEFPHILNWAVNGARSNGVYMPCFTGQLIEEEMQFVERQFLRNFTIIKFDK